MPRKMTGQRRECIRLLIPRQISSFAFTPDDRPDAVVRCSPQDLVTLLQGHAHLETVEHLDGDRVPPTLNQLLSERPP